MHKSAMAALVLMAILPGTAPAQTPAQATAPAAGDKNITAWAAKPAKLLPYTAPNRLVYRLADILAAQIGARFRYLLEYTYRNRIKVPRSAEQKSWANIRRGLVMLRNIFWKVGVLGDYRKTFWKFALSRLWRGDIEGLIACAMVGHHLIIFARAASLGQQNASNYSIRLREASVPAE